MLHITNGSTVTSRKLFLTGYALWMVQCRDARTFQSFFVSKPRYYCWKLSERSVMLRQLALLLWTSEESPRGNMRYWFSCFLLSAYHSIDLFGSIFHIIYCSIGLLSSRHSQKQCVFVKWLVNELVSYSNTPSVPK